MRTLVFTEGPALEWLRGIADPVRLDLLQGLSEVERTTAAELAARCQASLPTVRRHLDAMVLIGLIDEQAGESDGETPGRPAARFGLAAPVRESVCAVLGSGAE